MVFISEAVKSNNKLEKLFIAGNSINNLGLSSLVDALVSKNKSIQYLNLADNAFSKDYTSICKLLRNNNEIRYLDISSTVLDEEGLLEFSNSLKHNKSLKMLYMENCSLFQDKLTNLFKFFSCLKLCELHLNDNKFTEMEVKVINCMLENNKFLKIISMKNCNLTTPLLISIICKLNCEVEKLDVRKNSFSYDHQSVSTLIKMTIGKKAYVLININDTNMIELFSKSDRFIIY